MGAFDVFSARVPCPACGAIHHRQGQSKFFDPDFNGLFYRAFKPGVAQALDIDPQELVAASVWEFDWWRVRARQHDSEVVLMLDTDEWYRCTCSQPLLPALRFRLNTEPATATLLDITYFDPQDSGFADEIDFAEYGVAYSRSGAGPIGNPVAQAAQMPESDRKGLLRACAQYHFRTDGWGHDDLDAILKTYNGVLVAGEVVCEDCGRTCFRSMSTSLTNLNYEQPILGPGCSRQLLRPGTRVLGAGPWIKHDEDCGYYVRLRPPSASNKIIISSELLSWGCACEAGRALSLLEFSLEGDDAVLESIRLRHPRDETALADIDLFYAPGYSSGANLKEQHGWRPDSRSEAIAGIERELLDRR